MNSTGTTITLNQEQLEKQRAYKIIDLKQHYNVNNEEFKALREEVQPTWWKQDYMPKHWVMVIPQKKSEAQLEKEREEARIKQEKLDIVKQILDLHSQLKSIEYDEQKNEQKALISPELKKEFLNLLLEINKTRAAYFDLEKHKDATELKALENAMYYTPRGQKAKEMKSRQNIENQKLNLERKDAVLYNKFQDKKYEKLRRLAGAEGVPPLKYFRA